MKLPAQLSLLLFLFLPSLSTAQGHLVLIGGGTEIDGGWSDDPYRWGVQHAPNQRVAVVTYNTSATQWIPNYFMNLGADTARNFIINDAATADAQATYDSLLTYDAIFIKGGDQWQYISIYDNTLTEDAIRTTYQQGGVIMGTSAGMAVLSEVDFTAENGTVYPEEALADPYNNFMQLDSNFLDLKEGTIFDSHFVQRGRFGRMLGFLGRMEIDSGKDLLGIGVDDRTAFCIDTGDTGIAMGSGAVNLYKSSTVGTGDFDTSEQRLITPGFRAIVAQLLDSCSTTLEGGSSGSPGEVSGFENASLQPYDLAPKPGNRCVNVLLSGSDDPALNDGMVKDFHRKTSLDSIDDTVAVVSANSDLSLAGSMEQKLEQSGIHEAVTVQAIPSKRNDPAVTQKMDRADGLFFVNSSYDSLINMIGQGSAGQLLAEKVDSIWFPRAFMGSDARFAGASFVRYYDSTNASYYHDLELEEGLNALKGTVVLPNCFNPNGGYIENAASSLPYAMLKDSLPYGIQIPEGSHGHYEPFGWSWGMRGYGPYPLPIWRNSGAEHGFASVPVDSSSPARQIGGFEQMELALVDSANAPYLKLGSGIPRKEANDHPSLEILGNPVRHTLSYRAPFQKDRPYKVLDLQGRVLQEGTLQSGNGRISLKGLSAGLYILSYERPNGGYEGKRFVKE